MTTNNRELAAHLKNIRLKSELTLDDLAELTGISKATLSRIEKADTSPTAESLGALSSAFGLPISSLLSPLEVGFNNLIKSDDQPVFIDESNGFSRKNISPPSDQLSIEMIKGKLNANQSITYDQPTIFDQEHHLWLMQGELFLEIEGEQHHLNEGDCLRYKLKGTSRFSTKSKSAEYIIALSLRKL